MKQFVIVVALVALFGVPAGRSLHATSFNQDSQAGRFFVVGPVKSPGSYVYVGASMTVGQAIEIAGGVTERGVTDRFRISRAQAGKVIELIGTADEPNPPNDTVRALMKNP